MKILHITPSYFPALAYGGPIQSVHLLNKELTNQGLQVDVLTTNAGLSKEQKSEILRQAQNDSERWISVDEVRVKYLSFQGYEHYNFSILIYKAIKKIIQNYDLVHITAVWNFPVLAGSHLARKFNKPYIISPRGTIYKETIALKSKFVKKLYFKIFIQHYLNNADAIHFTTNDEQEKVMEYLNLKAPSFVIPNGIDLKEIESTLNTTSDIIDKFSLRNKKYLLFLGRIHPKKGLDLLIPSLKILLDRYDLYFVITGNGDTNYLQEIKKKINEFGIEDRTIFTGQIDGENKYLLYKNALAFVLPSYSENFGMAVVESMACGCPVIISDKVGIFEEVEQNNAGIIVKTTSESIEEGINKLLQDDELRNQISSNGKKMVEKHYDIEKVAILMKEKYIDIIRNRNN